MALRVNPCPCKGTIAQQPLVGKYKLPSVKGRSNAWQTAAENHDDLSK